MKTLLLALLISVPSLGLAHDKHDWRLDYEAQLNVVTEVPLLSQVNAAPSRIDMEFFKEKLKVFASRPRKLNGDLHIAREFLTEEYTKLGFEVSLHPFGTGTNFIAEKKGTKNPDKVLILSAHIDSVGNMGANDDGTGTIGALAVAKELAKKEYDFTVRVLGFDREEKGLQGSDAYVATISNKSSIIGDINIEMMGFHSKNDGAFHVIDCDRPFIWTVRRPNSEFLSAAIKGSIETLGLDLQIVRTCTGRSDHASFWRNNIPAIVISENFFGGDPDPCYHARCDVIDDRLNYPYMNKILDAVLDTTEKLLTTSL